MQRSLYWRRGSLYLWEAAFIENNALPTSLSALLAQLDQEDIQDHRRYQAVRKYLTFRARERDIPISGGFELTPLCNLDCKMCYVHLNKRQMQGRFLLSVETWKNLMQQTIDGGMMYATLTGGECLTYPGFREVYLFLREQGIETGILSNGILMDGEMTDFLRENPPASVQITLYGASEDAYERVTGHRAFSKVMDNIQRLRDAKLPLTIAVTPNAFMEDGEAVIQLIYSLGLPCRINSGLLAPREETGRQIHDAGIARYIRMLKQQMVLSGKAVPETCAEELLPESGGSGSAEYGVQCGAGRSGFCISWDGRLLPCNTFPGVSENVLEIPFAEGWKRINQQVKQFPLPAECAGCQYRHKCKHCVAEHASGAPLGHASPAVCDWARQMVAEGILKL